MNKHVHREAGADSFVGAHFMLIAGLMALATMLLCGCQASGSITAAHQQMERVEQKPTTRHITLDSDHVPTPIEMEPFSALWREHPPEKGASK